MARAKKREGSADEIMARLTTLENVDNAAGMQRFGIRPQTRLLGVSVTDLRRIAREYEPNHELALQLWRSEVHEARILASMVDIADEVAVGQMNSWARDFDSWDVCDQVCQNLFRYTPFVNDCAVDWMQADEEFVKRAGFVLVATAVSAGVITEDECKAMLPRLAAGMNDDRNFVKKAVSWAFRQIGKRNSELRSEVLSVAIPLLDSINTSTRWIARDVHRELRDPKV